MSRKEEKRRIREEKRQAAVRREKIRSTLVKAAVIVLVPLALYVFVYQGLLRAPPVYAPDEVGPDDHVRGPAEAALTITTYADFQCPACYTETQLFARAWPQIGNRVRLVFRHFPLDTHRHAFLAARYAEAAALQDRFWEMHDLLFVGQPTWSEMDDVRRTFDGYALQLSLDMDRLQQDIASQAVRNKIIADQQGGLRAGVRGTPAMFFNGRSVNNPASAGALIEMVNSALSGEGN